jgi:hypothetical protein
MILLFISSKYEYMLFCFALIIFLKLDLRNYEKDLSKYFHLEFPRSLKQIKMNELTVFDDVININIIVY